MESSVSISLKLENVFQCTIDFFLSHYIGDESVESEYRSLWCKYDAQLRKNMPEFRSQIFG